MVLKRAVKQQAQNFHALGMLHRSSVLLAPLVGSCSTPGALSAYLQELGEAEGDDLGHAQGGALAKAQVEVDVDHLPRLQVQQDVVQVPVPQAQHVAHLRPQDQDSARAGSHSDLCHPSLAPLPC